MSAKLMKATNMTSSFSNRGKMHRKPLSRRTAVRSRQTTLLVDQQADRWASPITYKFVGALRTFTDESLTNALPFESAWQSVCDRAAAQIHEIPRRAQTVRQGEPGGIYLESPK
jgi:hypothetical protein